MLKLLPVAFLTSCCNTIFDHITKQGGAKMPKNLNLPGRQNTPRLASVMPLTFTLFTHLVLFGKKKDNG